MKNLIGKIIIGRYHSLDICETIILRISQEYPLECLLIDGKIIERVVRWALDFQDEKEWREEEKLIFFESYFRLILKGLKIKSSGF
jgi:hypothetical protein